MEPAAFFDLDRTLLTVNSGSLWVRRERRLGRISLRQTLEAAAMLLAYRLSVVDIESSMRKALEVYRGVSEATLESWTREWFHSEVARHVSDAARAELEQVRAQGLRRILLTSSSPYAAKVASEHLGLDGFISSRYGVRDGVLTGEPVLPICYGRGKVVRAEEYAAEHGIDLARSRFYTDSFTDLPMLWRVGEPMVVNPDFRLLRYARRRGWPIVYWR
jgi:HAD superfamily hydrolase (TIGR01490 family)